MREAKRRAFLRPLADKERRAFCMTTAILYFSPTTMQLSGADSTAQICRGKSRFVALAGDYFANHRKAFTKHFQGVHSAQHRNGSHSKARKGTRSQMTNIDDEELNKIVSAAQKARGGKPAKYPELEKYRDSIEKLIENNVQLPFILKWLS